MRRRAIARGERLPQNRRLPVVRRGKTHGVEFAVEKIVDHIARHESTEDQRLLLAQIERDRITRHRGTIDLFELPGFFRLVQRRAERHASEGLGPIGKSIGRHVLRLRDGQTERGEKKNADGDAAHAHACFAWEPSQNGGFAVCLHMHQATLRFSVISTFTGENPLPLCEPSQKGCVEE